MFVLFLSAEVVERSPYLQCRFLPFRIFSDFYSRSCSRVIVSINTSFSRTFEWAMGHHDLIFRIEIFPLLISRQPHISPSSEMSHLRALSFLYQISLLNSGLRYLLNFSNFNSFPLWLRCFDQLHRHAQYAPGNMASPVVDTLASSYIATTSSKAGGAAEAAKSWKQHKYEHLEDRFIVQPVGFETFGTWGPAAGLFSSILRRFFGFGDPLAYLVIIVDFVINFWLSSDWHICICPCLNCCEHGDTAEIQI